MADADEYADDFDDVEEAPPPNRAPVPAPAAQRPQPSAAPAPAPEAALVQRMRSTVQRAAAPRMSPAEGLKTLLLRLRDDGVRHAGTSARPQASSTGVQSDAIGVGGSVGCQVPDDLGRAAVVRGGLPGAGAGTDEGGRGEGADARLVAFLRRVGSAMDAACTEGAEGGVEVGGLPCPQLPLLDGAAGAPPASTSALLLAGRQPTCLASLRMAGRCTVIAIGYGPSTTTSSSGCTLTPRLRGSSLVALAELRPGGAVLTHLCACPEVPTCLALAAGTGMGSGPAVLLAGAASAGCYAWHLEEPSSLHEPTFGDIGTGPGGVPLALDAGGCVRSPSACTLPLVEEQEEGGAVVAVLVLPRGGEGGGDSGGRTWRAGEGLRLLAPGSAGGEGKNRGAVAPGALPLCPSVQLRLTLSSGASSTWALLPFLPPPCAEGYSLEALAGPPRRGGGGGGGRAPSGTVRFVRAPSEGGGGGATPSTCMCEVLSGAAFLRGLSDGRVVVVGGEGGAPSAYQPPQGRTSPVLCIAVRPPTHSEPASPFACGYADGSVAVFTACRAAAVDAWRQPRLQGGGARILALAWTQSGALLAADADGRVIMWGGGAALARGPSTVSRAAEVLSATAAAVALTTSACSLLAVGTF